MTTYSDVTAAAPAVSVRAPRIPLVLLTGVAVALSLIPSLLPRPAALQGLLTGLLVAVAVGLGRVLGRVLGSNGRPARQLTRWLVLAAAGGVVALGVELAGRSLAASRADLGLGAAPDTYWPVAGATALLVCLALVGLGKGLLALLRRLRSPRTVALLTAAVALAAVGGPVVADSGWKALAAASDEVPVLTEPSPVVGSIRTYVGLDEAGTPQERAELAVDRLESTGAFEKRAIVLAIPTGSGWVNPFAVESFERGLRGNLATVAVQAGYAPSWVELFFHRPEQESSARALYQALAHRLADLPEGARPRLYLYGESLGALVGQTVAGGASASAPFCGVVWAGPPGNSILGTPGETVLRNVDDPVVQWRAGAILDRPDEWPSPLWLPGLSYLATTVDLMASLGAPPGHGHVYGPEQDWRLSATCA